MTQHDLDVASFEKAKQFFITGSIDRIEIGTTKGLQKIDKEQCFLAESRECLKSGAKYEFKYTGITP